MGLMTTKKTSTEDTSSSTKSKKEKRILRRVPGQTIVIELSIVPTETIEPKADPNGYYSVLGLDPTREWTPDDIARAYRVKAKMYHPDGSSPNQDLFHRVQVAYSILKDPSMREKYDHMDFNNQWLDEDVLMALIKGVVKKSGLEMQDLATAIRSKLVEEKHDAQEEDIPTKPRFSGYSYYYYEGEEVPPPSERRKWIDLLVGFMWGRGMRGELRLGFTEGDPHVVKKQWGEVLMTSGDPTPESASNLLKLIEDNPTWVGHNL